MRQYVEIAVKSLELEGKIDIDLCVFYLEEMLRWNKTHGLTTIVEPSEGVIKHLADSLSIHKLIKGERLVDVGSGAGFPGIPLALLFPEKQITLVESQNKKAAFLRHIKRTLKLSHVEIIQQRVEAFVPEQRFDGVITRAFSSLSLMLQLTKHLCAYHGYFLAMKGVFPEEELIAIEKNYPNYRVENIFVPGLEARRHCVIIPGEEKSQEKRRKLLQ